MPDIQDMEGMDEMDEGKGTDISEEQNPDTKGSS